MGGVNPKKTCFGRTAKIFPESEDVPGLGRLNKLAGKLEFTCISGHCSNCLEHWEHQKVSLCC